MSVPQSLNPNASHIDDVVGVEVTIDGILVIADRLHLTDFPPALGIRPNIPQEDIRERVGAQVARDLAAQEVLDAHGRPHPEVAAMVDALSRPDRTLDGRWWRRDVGEKMIRFVVCRKGDRHVIAARDGDLLVLQRIAPQVGLAGMGHKYPAELSGGMKKRAGLARALVMEPEIILFDEPTTGLDPLMAKSIHDLIVGTQRRFKFTAVMVSHEIPEIFGISDWVAMLRKGKIALMAPAAEFVKTTDSEIHEVISVSGPVTLKQAAG